MPRVTASKLLLIGLAALAWVCAPGSAFAQHGGGHGGAGGFHGGSGGGLHGGAFSGGGGFRGGSGGGGTLHSAPSMPGVSRGGSSFSRPGANSGNFARGGNSYRPSAGNAYRPSGNSAATGGNQRAGGFAGSNDATHDGQWHYFGSRGGASVAGQVGNPSGDSVRNFAANRPSTSAGATSAGGGANARSFAGQGGQVYEQSPRAVVGSATIQARTAVGAGGSSARGALFGSRGVSPSGGIAGAAFGSNVRGNFGVGSGARISALGRVGGFPGFRPGFGGRGGFPAFGPRFGFGRFGFGFGPAFGWGFGWGLGGNSCWGAWAWDPFCFSSFAPWPGYGGFYSYPSPYDPSYDLNFAPNFDSNFDPTGYDPGASALPPGADYDANGPANDASAANSDSADAVPPGESGASTPRLSGTVNPQGPVVIYMKDGSSIMPSDYWIADYRLHYVLGGRESSVDLDRVDLPRSNEENQKNGVRFWMKSEPDGGSYAPEQESPAPGPASVPAPQEHTPTALRFHAGPA